MAEPPDPGGTVPQPGNFVTISTTPAKMSPEIFYSNESGMDTDCSQRTLKRTRAVHKVLKHKRRKSLELTEKSIIVTPTLVNNDSGSQTAVQQSVQPTVRNLYKPTDKTPYIVHVQRIQDSPNDNTTLHPVTFGKFLQKNSFRSIVNGSVKRIGRNRITISFENYEAANAFVLHNSLETYKLKAFIPTYNVTRMGIVRGVPHEWSEEEIIEHVSVPDGCGKILKIRRINFKVIVDGVATWKPTQTIIVTFDGQFLPARVFMCYNALPVELYTYPTVQCYNCCRFGHTKINCRSKPRCFKCGGEHFGDTCQVDEDNFTCTSCSGSHLATSKLCPEFNRQKQIKSAMAERCMSYLEASKLFPPVSKSFAEVLASSPTMPQNINKMNASKDSDVVSYKKTFLLKPRVQSKPPQGYDTAAHQSLVKDYDMPPPQDGCALKLANTTNNTVNNMSITDIILALINLLTQSNLVLPSNAAPFLEKLTKEIIHNASSHGSSSVELPKCDQQKTRDN